jgi:hypothetical protein
MRHAGGLRAAGRIQRAVEEKALERFLECGDPHYGFARARLIRKVYEADPLECPLMADSSHSPGMHFSSSPCIRTASIA